MREPHKYFVAKEYLRNMRTRYCHITKKRKKAIRWDLWYDSNFVK